MGNHISYETSRCEADLGPRGKIRGIQHDDKAKRYAGIPYALPPTGEYRWRKPRPLPLEYSYSNENGDPFDGTSFQPPCWQKIFSSVAEHADGGQGYSEDCLRLNIWTPVANHAPGSRGWPVYVWLHGGWFQMGDPSQDPGMDPTELISTAGANAVVVAVGYRLNVFGFLAGKALAEESKGSAVGNYGLWDQRLALEWIHDNIGAFGGDVTNVTLAGRSAGAYGVHAQMLYDFRSRKDDEKRLFHRLFMCSNAIPSQPKTPDETDLQFDELCEKLGISKGASNPEKLNQLRHIPAETLIRTIGAMENHTFRPVTDDLFIRAGLIEYQSSGALATDFLRRKCRLLIGEVANEETLYATYNPPTEPNLHALETQVHNYYAQDVTRRVLQKCDIPKSDDISEWSMLFGTIIADGQVRAPSRLLVDSLVTHGVPVSDVWRYRIGYRLSFIDEGQAPRSFGVAHAMDKPFWNFSITHGPTAKEQTLMKDWIDNLVAFMQDDGQFDFGTRSVADMKVVTADGQIKVEEDQKYSSLVDLARVFTG